MYFFLFQAGTSEKFPAPYTTTMIMCLMASIECGAIGLVVERNMSAWSLRDGTKLVASLYAVIFSLSFIGSLNTSLVI